MTEQGIIDGGCNILMTTRPCRPPGTLGNTGHATKPLRYEVRDDSTALTFDFSNAHARFGSTLVRQGDANSARADRGGHAPLLLSPVYGEECVAEMQFRCHNPNTRITELNAHPALPSTNPVAREMLFNSKSPVNPSV